MKNDADLNNTVNKFDPTDIKITPHIGDILKHT